MKRITKRSSIVAVSAAATLVVGGGVAFAYWTTSGSNTASADVATDVSASLTVTPSAITGLFPGGSAQDVTVVVANPSTTDVRYSNVAVQLVSTDKPGCTVDNFQLTPVAIAPQILNAGASSGPIVPATIAMLETGVNQDVCKNAAVTLSLQVS